MVMDQVEYFFRVAAFASSMLLPSALISELSYSKNTGFSGELRFKSSSDAEAMRSSFTGSGGTSVGSATGSGGAGGRAAATGGAGLFGGGAGRAMGGFLPPHAAASDTSTITTKRALLLALRIICSLSSGSGRTLQTNRLNDHFDQSG